MECVVPLVTGTCMKRKKKFKHGDIYLSEYEQFDDYLEMVIQFGVSASLYIEAVMVTFL